VRPVPYVFCLAPLTNPAFAGFFRFGGGPPCRFVSPGLLPSLLFFPPCLFPLPVLGTPPFLIPWGVQNQCSFFPGSPPPQPSRSPIGLVFDPPNGSPPVNPPLHLCLSAIPFPEATNAGDRQLGVPSNRFHVPCFYLPLSGQPIRVSTVCQIWNSHWTPILPPPCAVSCSFFIMGDLGSFLNFFSSLLFWRQLVINPKNFHR